MVVYRGLRSSSKIVILAEMLFSVELRESFLYVATMMNVSFLSKTVSFSIVMLTGKHISSPNSKVSSITSKSSPLPTLK